MSGLAKYLLQNNFEVSGSDICDSKYVQMVKALGAKVYIGHDQTNVPEDSIVVASTAIRNDNPEIQKAKSLGLPIWHRSDLLAEISKSKNILYTGTVSKSADGSGSGLLTEKKKSIPERCMFIMIKKQKLISNSDNFFYCKDNINKCYNFLIRNFH